MKKKTFKLITKKKNPQDELDIFTAWLYCCPVKWEKLEGEHTYFFDKEQDENNRRQNGRTYE